MDSKEKQADTPADINPASDVSPAPIENTSAQSEAQPSAPEPAKHPRLSESQLESAHTELPPLSSIPTGGTVTEDNASLTGEVAETRTQSRRGLGRGNGARSAGNQPRQAVGIVENPTEMTENLSGQFAAGYGDRPERRERPERAERPEPHRDREAPAESNATENAGNPWTKTPEAGDGPREFVPPVSQGTYKAEMNPERERQAREEKRRERQPFNKDAAGNARGDNREPRQPRESREARDPRESREPRERRDQQGRDWTPTPRTGDAGRPAERGARQKLVIEPAKMPVQPDESFFGKIKKFFGNLFGGGETAKPAKTGDNKFGERDGNRNDRGRGQYRDQRGHGRGRGGEFRHGNRGGNQGFNRNEGRRRSHSHGANRHDKPDGE